MRNSGVGDLQSPKMLEAADSITLFGKMNQHIYRPPSVWITQILLVLTFGNLAIALPAGLVQCFTSGQIQSCSSFPKIASFVTGCLILVLLGLTFWGLQKRKRYSKWLAVSFLIGSMIVAIAQSPLLQLIYTSVTQGQSLPASYECWKEDGLSYISRSCGYSSYPEMVQRIVLDILPAMLLGFLAVRLLYSDAAKRFFYDTKPIPLE